jgi:hypothetical protein
MSLVRIVGVPGTGKTTVCEGLEARGYMSRDIDRDGFAIPVDNSTGALAKTIEPTAEWHSQHSWRLNLYKVHRLRILSDNALAFLCGTVTDDSRLWDQFDMNIALLANEATIAHRLAARTNHTFGKSQQERDLVLRNMAGKNEQYRMMGAVLIDSTRPVEAVIDEVIRCTRPIDQPHTA